MCYLSKKEQFKIQIIQKAKRPQVLCINPDCKSKVHADKKAHEKEGTVCPKCKKGKIVMRKSFYGEFLACDAFPKCRHTEKV